MVAQRRSSKISSVQLVNFMFLYQNEESAEAIRQAFEKLHSTLEEREKQLQSELHDLILCKTTSLGLQKEKFEKMSQDASRYLDFASKLLQNGSDHEVIAMKRLTSTQLEAIFNKANSEHLVPCEHSDITVSMETDSVVDELLNFGDIIDFRPSPKESIWEPVSPAIVNTVYTLKVKARDSNGCKYPHGGVKIDVRAELRPIANDQRTSHGKSENHWDGTYTITLTPQTTGPHQLHITMDGQHIKNSPYDLQVRKSKLDYSAGLGDPHLNVSVTSPLCIAIHKKSGDIFVGSEANCIYVYSKDGAQKTTFGSAGNVSSIDHVDWTSKEMSCMLGKGEGEFNCPSEIVVDFNDRLIVADHGNSRIQILTSKGSFLVSMDLSKSPGLDLSNICGIALDVQGNIHVVARCNNSGWIIVFTPGGAFVSKHQTVVKPTAIGIDVEGYELVCDEETQSLHVYDAIGNKCGTAVKNVTNPIGIVFDKGTFYIVQRQYSRSSGLGVGLGDGASKAKRKKGRERCHVSGLWDPSLVPRPNASAAAGGLHHRYACKRSGDVIHPQLRCIGSGHETSIDHEVIAMKRLPFTQLEAIFNKANKIPRGKYPHGGVKIDVRAELRPIANDQWTSHGKSENHWDGTYTITLTPQTTGPHQLHITMDGQHIKNSPYDLQVRKSKLDYSAGLGNPQLNVSVTSPLCIAIHKKSGDIFVGSEANCIYVYSKDGAQKTTIGSAGNSLCQFNRPCGLDITGDVLYVADCNNHRIQKLDLSGSFICTFGRPGKGKGELNHPSAIVVDFNDRLIDADQGNSRIQILTSKGSFLVSIDQSKSPCLDLSNICGIALDVQGNIHVVARCKNSG
ncbi:hypothetical protein EMCRGX_G018539 [Ephydatia muelleri]